MAGIGSKHNPELPFLLLLLRHHEEQDNNKSHALLVCVELEAGMQQLFSFSLSLPCSIIFFVNVVGFEHQLARQAAATFERSCKQRDTTIKRQQERKQSNSESVGTIGSTNVIVVFLDSSLSTPPPVMSVEQW